MLLNSFCLEELRALDKSNISEKQTLSAESHFWAFNGIRTGQAAGLPNAPGLGGSPPPHQLIPTLDLVGQSWGYQATHYSP